MDEEARKEGEFYFDYLSFSCRFFHLFLLSSLFQSLSKILSDFSKRNNYLNYLQRCGFD